MFCCFNALLPVAAIGWPPPCSPLVPQGFGHQSSQALKLLRAETVFQMALGDIFFTNSNKKQVKGYGKAAEKRQEGQEMNRGTAAAPHSGRRCHMLTPGTKRSGLERIDLPGAAVQCHAQLVPHL